MSSIYRVTYLVQCPPECDHGRHMMEDCPQCEVVSMEEPEEMEMEL